MPDAVPTDRELLLRWQEGAEWALDHLVERYAGLVRSACRRVLGAQHPALEDAVQACFLLLAQRGWSLRQPERLACWLHGTATRLALGPRIMRADTAAVAALALVNAVLGDWR